MYCKLTLSDNNTKIVHMDKGSKIEDFKSYILSITVIDILIRVGSR